MQEHSPHARAESFAHEADIGIRGLGETPTEAFTMAAQALSQAVTNLASIRLTENIEIDCDAANLEMLFYEWINRIIYEMDTRRMVFGKFQLRMTDNHLHAILSGETVDSTRHELAVDPKGATFTELKVIHENGIWLAQCVVDV